MALFTTWSCNGQSQSIADEKKTIKDEELNGLSTAYVASGCFWCVEAIYEAIDGVHEVVSGYSGGNEENPTYQMVGRGQTSHAEAVAIYYDPKTISYEKILRVYFAGGDPTQVNGQGPDKGTQYRSIIFYKDSAEYKIAKGFMDSLVQARIYTLPLAVEIKPFKKFWKAEEYHQDYVNNNPYDPYVQHESIPRMKRALALVPDLVKKKR